MHPQLHDSGPMFLAPAGPSFELDIEARYERCNDPSPSYIVDAHQPKVVETRATRIVRAISGQTEFRLLKETEDGVHTKYILAKINLSPYAVQKEPLMTQLKRRDSGDLLPMHEDQALKAFDSAVAAAYPSLPTRGGKMVATCIDIL
jgi:hypothetical protein